MSHWHRGEPLIQINPSYKRGAHLKELVDGGVVDPRSAEVFRADGAPLVLYKHQEQAIALASQGESYVVTTGTGVDFSISCQLFQQFVSIATFSGARTSKL